MEMYDVYLSEFKCLMWARGERITTNREIQKCLERSTDGGSK